MHDRDRKHGGSNSDLVAILIENRRAFLRFVERRVGSRDVAEEILQSAFAKNLEKLDAVHDTAAGWFYRVLRNAIIDHRRRAAALERRLDAYARDDGATNARDNELHRVVCKCVGELAATLKPEYASALRRIELDGVSVKDYATETGISRSNAGVRVFRARGSSSAGRAFMWRQRMLGLYVRQPRQGQFAVRLTTGSCPPMSLSSVSMIGMHVVARVSASALESPL